MHLFPHPSRLFTIGVLLPLAACAPTAQSQRSAHLSALTIEVQDSHGASLAATESARGVATLHYNYAYQPGDRILITGPIGGPARNSRHLALRLDDAQPECQLLVTGPASGAYAFQVPLGRAEQEPASAYAPSAFAGVTHQITARVPRRAEWSGYRNLALNPCDQQAPKEAPVEAAEPTPIPAESQPTQHAFPHVSSNSVYKNWPDFRERNAIDGVTQNGHHGPWPYQSWGPERRADLWFKLDFGQPVSLDKIRLMMRADFPHDSSWQSATVRFSDGSSLPIQVRPVADFQEFSFPTRKVTWLRLTHLVPAAPNKWCSLVEIEAWGRTLR
jgi:hypothetical protein